MTITNDGSITGTPTQAISATVILVVQDQASAFDTVSFPIETRDVEIAGGPAGPISPGESYSLTASGGVATYRFSLQIDQSGASLSPDGSYTAGNSGGIDVIRATDNDGFYEELAVTVGSDPFIGFQASFGTTDVWWINWDVVYDPSPVYASDLDEVLVALGLRAQSSTDVDGTEADQLARLLVIRRALGWLSKYYGNNDDGSPAGGGLSISFVGPAGTSGQSPGVGGIQTAAPNRYSQICVRYGPDAGIVGTAWLDGGNTNVEHDCGNPQNTALGVFANRILAPYLSAYNNDIANNPVGASDVNGLRAMLNGAAPSNGRETAIFGVADGFGKTIAAVLAHEVGHSLGLDHSNPSTGSGDIMNASLSVGRNISYAFNATHWGQLQSNLPGPNR